MWVILNWVCLSALRAANLELIFGGAANFFEIFLLFDGALGILHLFFVGTLAQSAVNFFYQHFVVH